MISKLNPVRPWSWRSLQTRITVLTLSAFLLSIWSLSFFASRILHRDIEQLLSEQQFATVSSHADGLNRTLAERITTLEVNTPLISSAMMQDRAAMQAFLQARPVLPKFFNGGFFVTDATGTAIASLPISANRLGVNFIERDHVATALQQGISVVSKPVIGKMLGSAVVSLAVPIRDEQGHIIGCLVGVIDLGKPNFLDQVLSAHSGRIVSYMLIANRWHLVVSATDKQHMLKELPAVGTNPNMDRIAQGFEGSMIMRDLHGVEVLASVSRIPVAGWSMVVSLPTTEAFAPINHIIRIIGLATFLASLLTGSLTWWLLRRQLSPMHAAFQSLVTHADSQQPLQALPKTSDDEVGQLISGFNHLIEILAQREADLKHSGLTTRLLATRLDEAQKISQLGSWTLDIASGKLNWSNEIYRLFEINKEQSSVTYEAFLDAIHQDDRERVNNAFLTSLSTHTPYQIEHRLRMADGRIKWVHERCKSEYDAHGKALRSIGTVQDITERKLAEIARIESHNLLMTVIDSFPIRVFWKDMQLNYLGCNTEFAHDAGKQCPADVIGKDDYQLGWADRADRYRADDRKVIDSGIAQLFFDEPLTLPGGQTIWLRTSKIPLKSQAGQVIGVLGVYEDITQRRQAKERLKKLSMVAEQCPESVVITDLAANIEYVNDAFLRNTGYQHEEAIGHNPHVLHSGQTPKSTYDAMWQSLTQGETWSGELVNQRKDGSIFTEWAIISPLRDFEGQITHYVAIKEDITEKKCIANELDQHRNHLENLVKDRTEELNQARILADAANQSKSEFLANMSHEIRTPMNGVIGMIDILMKTELTSEQKRMLATINNSSHALLTILNDILDFSKIEAGKLDVEQVPTPLREVVEGVALLMQNVAVNKDAEISLFIDPTLPDWIISDPTRLRQILFNLMGNALKFVSNRAGCTILNVQPVTHTDGSVWVQLRVIDNGIGMSPEVMDKLFQPFTQADASTMRRFGGTGLGLSITHSLVLLLHGSISVHSTPNMGSEFTVELPLQAATPPEGHRPLELPDLHGVSVVAVTPSVACMTLLQTYLGLAGAEVVVVPDLAAARQQLGQSPDDTVLLLDLAHAIGLSMDHELATPNNTRVVCLVRRGCSSTESQAIEVPARPLLFYDLLKGVALASGCLCLTEMNRSNDPRHHQHAAVDESTRSDHLILIAEDNETSSEVMHEQLRLLGYASEVAHDGVAALAMWRSGRFALLLTDCHMPHMDGFELTATIRQEEPPGTHLPIIAATANAMQGEAERCCSRGMDDYLCKPVRMNELGKKLSLWLPLPTPALTASLIPKPDVPVAHLVGDNPATKQHPGFIS